MKKAAPARPETRETSDKLSERKRAALTKQVLKLLLRNAKLTGVSMLLEDTPVANKATASFEVMADGYSMKLTLAAEPSDGLQPLLQDWISALSGGRPKTPPRTR